jgi:hypothetical protein
MTATRRVTLSVAAKLRETLAAVVSRASAGTGVPRLTFDSTSPRWTFDRDDWTMDAN